MDDDHRVDRGWPRPAVVAFVAFAAIAGYFLIAEHRAHVVAFLPWLLLAACPLLHVFMHRGHGGHSHREARPCAPEARSGEEDTR